MEDASGGRDAGVLRREDGAGMNADYRFMMRLNNDIDSRTTLGFFLPLVVRMTTYS